MSRQVIKARQHLGISALPINRFMKRVRRMFPTIHIDHAKSDSRLVDAIADYERNDYWLMAKPEIVEHTNV